MTALGLFPTLRPRRARYTKVFVLTPNSLVDTAVSDIKRKRANWGKHPGPYNALAFHPRHIKRGDLPADVLKRALRAARRVKPGEFGKRQFLYDSVPALKGALALVGHS